MASKETLLDAVPAPVAPDMGLNDLLNPFNSSAKTTPAVRIFYIALVLLMISIIVLIVWLNMSKPKCLSASDEDKFNDWLQQQTI